MNQESPVAGAAMFDLGVVLGQYQTFSLIAGRCSAAQAASLHRLKKERQYTQVTRHWSEFCSSYLKLSRSAADQIVRLYEEFGPGYFELAQWTRVSPETYRTIAPQVHSGALHWDGQAIEISAENSRRIGEAVAQMRKAFESPKAPTSTDLERRLGALSGRCTAFIAELQEISDHVSDELAHCILASSLQRTYLELRRLHHENGIPLDWHLTAPRQTAGS